MKVLVIAPHADDETIGVGGTIARHAADDDDVTVAVITGHGPQPHPLWKHEVWEVVRAEARRACDVLGVRELIFEEVPAALVAEQPTYQLNRITDTIVRRVESDMLYVPFPFDLHKDHREVFHSLSVAWRPSSEVGRRIAQVYAYETQSETHWNAPYIEPGFLPNTWVDISDQLECKLEAVSCYRSQLRPAPDSRSVQAVRALALWRGSQMNMAAAEGFVLVRALR